MKRTKYKLLFGSIALLFLLNACAVGPRAVGTPGLTADGNIVYVAFQQYVYAVDTTSGIGASYDWQYPVTGNAKVVFYAPPEVSQDAIYVGDLANVFHKLNKENGAEIWSFNEGKGWFIGKAKASEETIFAQSSDRSLYALSTNGSLIWKFESDQSNWAQPVVNKNDVFIASMDHFIYSLDVSNGSENWRKEMSGAIASAPVFDETNDQLYVGSLGRKIVALNVQDGSEIWAYPSDDSIGSIWATPILKDEQLIFVDEKGKIFSLDAASGTLNWSADAGGDVMAGLLALEDGFLVALEDGNVIGYNYEGSRSSLFFQVDGEIYSTPVFADGVIVIATIKGESLLYGYDLNGKQVFSFKPGR